MVPTCPAGTAQETRLGSTIEQAVDDSPRGGYCVGAGEQSRIAVHGVVDEALVRGHAADLVIAHVELDVATHLVVSWPLAAHAEGDGDAVWAEPEPKMVAVAGQRLVEKALRGSMEGGQHLGGRDGEVFARPDQERHPAPPPRVDVQPQRRRRSRWWSSASHARLVGVADVLTTHEVSAARLPDGVEHLDPFVAQRSGRHAHRRLHG